MICYVDGEDMWGGWGGKGWGGWGRDVVLKFEEGEIWCCFFQEQVVACDRDGAGYGGRLMSACMLCS